MCSPETVNVIGAVGSVAGSYGQYSAAQAQAQLNRQMAEAQAQAYEAEAAISDINADISLQQGGVAVSRGADALRRLKQTGAAYIGSAKAVASANGLATTEGSAADVIEDTAAQLALDVEALRLNTKREKWGYDVQSINYRNMAAMQRVAGENTRRGGAYAADVASRAARTSLLAGITAAGVKLYKDGIVYGPARRS